MGSGHPLSQHHRILVVADSIPAEARNYTKRLRQQLRPNRRRRSLGRKGWWLRLTLCSCGPGASFSKYFLNRQHRNLRQLPQCVQYRRRTSKLALSQQTRAKLVFQLNHVRSRITRTMPKQASDEASQSSESRVKCSRYLHSYWGVFHGVRGSFHGFFTVSSRCSHREVADRFPVKRFRARPLKRDSKGSGHDFDSQSIDIDKIYYILYIPQVRTPRINSPRSSLVPLLNSVDRTSRINSPRGSVVLPERKGWSVAPSFYLSCQKGTNFIQGRMFPVIWCLPWSHDLPGERCLGKFTAISTGAVVSSYITWRVSQQTTNSHGT